MRVYKCRCPVKIDIHELSFVKRVFRVIKKLNDFVTLAGKGEDGLKSTSLLSYL